MKQLLVPCDHCDHPSFCQEVGCTTWNDEARRQWEAWERIHSQALEGRYLGRRRRRFDNGLYR